MKKTIMAIGLAACFSAPAFAQGDVFRIGVLNDQSGTYSDFGGVTSVVAAKMAVEDFGGEVHGEQVEVLAADRQNKTDIGTATPRKWFDVDGLVAFAHVPYTAL